MPWYCLFASSPCSLISGWSLPTQQDSSPSWLCRQSLSPLGICGLLQPLFTRSWPQHIHFSHFITIASDSNLLANWVSSSKPDIQAVRWISSSAWLAQTLQVIDSGLLNVLEPRPPSRGAAVRGYPLWPFFLFRTHNSRPVGRAFWLKTESVFIPYLAVSAVSSHSKAASLQSGHLVEYDWLNCLGIIYLALLLLYLLSDLFAYRTETTSDLFFFLFLMIAPQVRLLFF